MCGIAVALSWDHKDKDGKVLKGAFDTNETVKNIFLEQRSRGTQGFGMVTLDKEGRAVIDRTTVEVDALIGLRLERSRFVMFHHRQPTSTPNNLLGTHPIPVSSEKMRHNWLVIHNGIINNDDEVRKEHERMGYRYKTVQMAPKYQYTKYSRELEEKFNDSEALAVDLAMFKEGLKKSVTARGSAAYVMLKMDKETGKPLALFWGRNTSNPLNVASDQNRLVLSSEGPGDPVAPGFMYGFGMVTQERLKKVKCEVPTGYSSTSYKPSGLLGQGTTKKEEDKKEEKKAQPIGFHTPAAPDYKRQPRNETESILIGEEWLDEQEGPAASVEAWENDPINTAMTSVTVTAHNLVSDILASVRSGTMNHDEAQEEIEAELDDMVDVLRTAINAGITADVEKEKSLCRMQR